MEPSTLTFIILGAAMVAFISSRVPLAVVACAVIILLWATGVSTASEVFSGFAEPTVVFVVSLFIIIEALNTSGVTAWLANIVVGQARGSRSRLVLVIGTAAGVLGAFISVSGTVGALLSVVMVASARARILPSKMLIPLAFLASGGSVLTLTASPVNIVVSDAAEGNGGRAFGYFEFALVGVPLVIVTILVVLFAGDRLLPARPPGSAVPPDPFRQAQLMQEEYSMEVGTDSIFTPESGVIEALVAPRSELIGRRLIPGGTVFDQRLVVLAVRRGKELGPAQSKDAKYSTGFPLQVGDAILFQGQWTDLENFIATPAVVAVDEPQSLRRALPLSSRYKRTLIIFVAMIVTLATELAPAAIVTISAAVLLVISGVVKLPEAYRAVPWSIAILIGGMVPLSRAFVDTGAADIIADHVLAVVGSGSPYLALFTICVIAMLLGQFMSNLATVLVMLPICVAIAQSTGASIQPFMMGLAVCGAASFLTPVATAGNLIIMQPGGYRFGDYWKLGLPLMVIYLTFSVIYVPLVWKF